MPCEHCLNRREFLARAAGGAAIAAIVACGDGQLSGVAPRGAGMGPTGGAGPLVITVADFSGLATTGRLVAVNSFTVVKRTGAATFDAFDLTCTHQGCLTDVVNGQQMSCPCHGSRFASDGSVINGPNTGESIGPLRKFTTSYDQATDKLTIS
jgi:Rieske Fe-S protein